MKALPALTEAGFLLSKQGGGVFSAGQWSRFLLVHADGSRRLQQAAAQTAPPAGQRRACGRDADAGETHPAALF